MQPITCASLAKKSNGIRHLLPDQSFDAVVGCSIKKSCKGEEKQVTLLETDHRPPYFPTSNTTLNPR
jgi:hypothetical protein